MRLIFAGTPDVAVPSLQALLDSDRHEVVAVLTRPDAPAGRGQRPARSPVGALADKAGVKVLTPRRLRDPDFLAQLSALTPDCCPIVGYGALVPRLAPHAERNAQIGFAMLLGPVALFLGIALATAGQRDEAERWLREAIERSRVLGTVTAEVHARCAYGELLPPAEGARDQLAHALASAERLGMAGLARRAEEGLARVP